MATKKTATFTHRCCICNNVIPRDKLPTADEMVAATVRTLVWTCADCVQELEWNSENSDNELEDENAIFDDMEQLHQATFGRRAVVLHS